MKLKGKMSLSFCALVFFIVVGIGTVAYEASISMGIADAEKTMDVSADFAAQEISGKLQDYLRMTQVTGTDTILATNEDNAVVSERIDTLASSYGFTSGNVLDTSGISRKDGSSFADRDYVQKALSGEANISDLTVSKLTGNYGFSVAAPLSNPDLVGVVYYRMDVDFMKNILDQIEVSENSYAYVVDGNGLVIVHPDESLIGTLNITDSESGLGKHADEIMSKECGTLEYTKKGTNYLCGFSSIEGTNGWTVVIVAPESDFLAATLKMTRKLLIIDVIALLFALAFSILFSNFVGNSVKKVSTTLSSLAEGNLEQEIPFSKRKDEIASLQNSARDLQMTFHQIIEDTNLILGSMANYDLTQKDMAALPGDFNQLSNSVNRIKLILHRLIQEVQMSASSVGAGSGQLAQAAENLAQGTVTQANSIDHLVRNVDDIADRISRNSSNEAEVQKRLEVLDELIRDGNSQMHNLSEVVKQVEGMSSDIQNIVGTIDSIAFQINILALNASVEAARAGESGRGFAVVADEVGSLAAKTSESSKMTAELITDCLAQIQNAMSCAEATSKCLDEIVENSEVISDAFRGITADTQEQAARSATVQQEITSISDVVQTNTSTAQETAAATQVLSEQAVSLSEVIARFRV